MWAPSRRDMGFRALLPPLAPASPTLCLPSSTCPPSEVPSPLRGCIFPAFLCLQLSLGSPAASASPSAPSPPPLASHCPPTSPVPSLCLPAAFTLPLPCPVWRHCLHHRKWRLKDGQLQQLHTGGDEGRPSYAIRCNCGSLNTVRTGGLFSSVTELCWIAMSGSSSAAVDRYECRACFQTIACNSRPGFSRPVHIFFACQTPIALVMARHLLTSHSTSSMGQLNLVHLSPSTMRTSAPTAPFLRPVGSKGGTVWYSPSGLKECRAASAFAHSGEPKVSSGRVSVCRPVAAKRI